MKLLFKVPEFPRVSDALRIVGAHGALLLSCLTELVGGCRRVHVGILDRGARCSVQGKAGEAYPTHTDSKSSVNIINEHKQASSNTSATRALQQLLLVFIVSRDFSSSVVAYSVYATRVI